MKIKNIIIIWLVSLTIFSCAPISKIAPTEMVIPTETLAPTVDPTAIFTPTSTPTTTPRPTKTPIPIVYVTLGNPFAADCGDGIPKVWSNDAYNFTWYPKCNDDHHGHVDWFVPTGCDINSYKGEALSPVNGTLRSYNDDKGKLLGVHISLDQNEYPLGILDALKFAGIENLSLKKIMSVAIDFGHISLIKSGHVNRWEPIGEIIPANNNFKIIAYKVNVEYQGYGEIPFSPNLFPNELHNGDILQPMLDGTTTNWVCVPGSPYDCVPEVKDYAPTCKLGN